MADDGRARGTVHSVPSEEDVAVRRLDNGMLLAARENFASPAVVMTGLLEVGAMDEPTEREGLASLCASLLTRGTERFDYDALNEAIEGVGASVGISGRTHTTAASAKSLAEDFPTILELVGEMLRRPTFPEEQLRRVRDQRLTYLQERAQNTRAVASLNFYKMLYPPGHPYHSSSSGTPETVAAISREELVAFHQQSYDPTGAIFVVVGAIPREEALDRLEALFGDWAPLPGRPGRRRAPDVPLPESPLEHLEEMPGKSQSDIVYGLATIPRDHADFMTLQLANMVLGVFGMMGRIGRTVRDEQGLAYYARSGIDATLGPSAWSATAGVAPENIERAVRSIREEWVRLTEELVSEEELNDSKMLLSGSLPLRLETNGGVARSLLDILYYDLGLDYLQRYETLVEAITPGEIQRVASSYFDPRRTVLAVAGPPAAGQGTP